MLVYLPPCFSRPSYNYYLKNLCRCQYSYPLLILYVLFLYSLLDSILVQYSTSGCTFPMRVKRKLEKEASTANPISKGREREMLEINHRPLRGWKERREEGKEGERRGFLTPGEREKGEKSDPSLHEPTAIKKTLAPLPPFLSPPHPPLQPFIPAY